MKNSKKILITTESHEIFIVRMNRKSRLCGFCPNCAEEAELLTLDEAVSFSARNTRELIRQIEANSVHSIETLSGHLLICQKSLANDSTPREKK